MLLRLTIFALIWLYGVEEILGACTVPDNDKSKVTSRRMCAPFEYNVRNVGMIIASTILDEFVVLCDTNREGGPWILFQRRWYKWSSTSFDVRAKDYKYGFGECYGNHWMGLLDMYKIVRQKGTKWELLVEFWDNYEGRHFLVYEYLKIEATNKYETFTFTIGKLLRKSKWAQDPWTQNGKTTYTATFHTKYSDPGDCARQMSSGWLYPEEGTATCPVLNLNAPFGTVDLRWGWHTNLTGSEMKIRDVLLPMDYYDDYNGYY